MRIPWIQKDGRLVKDLRRRPKPRRPLRWAASARFTSSLAIQLQPTAFCFLRSGSSQVVEQATRTRAREENPMTRGAILAGILAAALAAGPASTARAAGETHAAS